MSTFIRGTDCDIKDDQKKDRSIAKCEPKHPLPKKLLFECGDRGAPMTFTSEGQSFTASSVSIDTTCLFRPKIKLEFSSIVTFNGVVGTEFPFEVRLRFELIKVCDNRQEIVCDTQMYERVINVRFDGTVLNTPLTLTDSFSFVFCECNTCPGCCQYFVRVTSDVISMDSGSNNVTATVDNGRIGIFATEC